MERHSGLKPRYFPHTHAQFHLPAILPWLPGCLSRAHIQLKVTLNVAYLRLNPESSPNPVSSSLLCQLAAPSAQLCKPKPRSRSLFHYHTLSPLSPDFQYSESIHCHYSPGLFYWLPNWSPCSHSFPLVHPPHCRHSVFKTPISSSPV